MNQRFPSPGEWAPLLALRKLTRMHALACLLETWGWTKGLHTPLVILVMCGG